jgi:hypothetical protein
MVLTSSLAGRYCAHWISGLCIGHSGFPSHLPGTPGAQAILVIHFDGEFFLDHCCPFGAASRRHLAGRDRSRRCRKTLRGRHACHPISYSFTLALPRPTWRTSIHEPVNSIGAPWPLIKSGAAFTYTIVYLGILWDLPLCRISLPEPKRLKFLSRVEIMLDDIRASRRFSLLELDEIHGSLCHLVFIYREGAPRLSPLANFMSRFNDNRFKTRWLGG